MHRSYIKRPQRADDKLSAPAGRPPHACGVQCCPVDGVEFPEVLLMKFLASSWQKLFDSLINYIIELSELSLGNLVR